MKTELIGLRKKEWRKNKMKKILALVLTMSMMIAMAACGGGGSSSGGTAGSGSGGGSASSAAPSGSGGGSDASTSGSGASSSTGGGGAAISDLNVGVFWYAFSDAFLSTVRTALNKDLDDAGIKYQDFDGNNTQATQLEQIQTAVTNGVNLLVVNLVTSGYLRFRRCGAADSGCRRRHPRDLLQPRD